MKNFVAFLCYTCLQLSYISPLTAQPFWGKEKNTERSTNSVPGLEQSNVTWNSAGKDFHDAMPTGNGDIGVSMWIEKEGDLLFYISKTDAYDDNNRLLKIGLVRVKIAPNPFVAGDSFLQQLHLKQSVITVQTGSGNNTFKLRLWVDANHPVIRLEMAGNKKFTSTVQLQNWRREKHTLEDLSFSDVYKDGFDGSKSGEITIQYPDSILVQQHNTITWYHQNKHSCWPFTLKLQGLEELTKTQTDPLLNNIFGAAINGNGLMQKNDTTLIAAHPELTQNITVNVLTKTSTTPAVWLNALNKQKAGIEKLAIEQCRSRHALWWAQFWNRSYINIHTATDTGAVVTRSYNLQRYLTACSGRGKGWIKFNGSIFTLPNEHDADFRRWGPANWFQNIRLAYWPAINAGDFDILSPFYTTYLRALPLAKKRTALYYGHKGAFFSETSYTWGTYSNGDYGFNREGITAGFVTNPYIRRHWSNGIELTAMMLQQYQLTNNKHFLTDTLLPIATAIIQFYDEHWKRGVDGKILFDPSQSLETWQTAVNPMPEIAGLQNVLSQLLDFAPGIISPQQLTSWRKTLNDLPALPMKTIHGKKVLLPAETVTESFNSENPELYAVFPFRIYGVEKPSLEIARNTFARRTNKESFCWYQDDAQAAYLGLATEAARGVTKRMTNWNKEYAFPAMWGPGDDGLPDFDHGGVGQLALQAMLMQTEKNKILLFPAWPKDWDVYFRFPAPHNTMVEGKLINGKLQQLKVTPASRQKDVVILPVQ
jgi:alpha-L-fucosidase 2